MNKPLNPAEEMSRFMEDVKEQIEYKPIRSEIEKELKAHIEDRTLEYMDMGMNEQESSHKAIEQMGDPSSIGIMMNEARRVKNCWPLAGMVLVSILAGVLYNLINSGLNWRNGMLTGTANLLSGTYYYLWGVGVLLFVWYKGYPFLVKHAKALLIGFMAAFCKILSIPL